MYILIIMLPLLGSIFSGIFGRKLGVTGSQIITILSLTTASLLSILAFYEVGLSGSPVMLNINTWFNTEIMNVNWGFLFDTISVSFLIAVTLVSTLVHIYSVNYMAEDPVKYSRKILNGFKLSNSGDTLKLMIPNYIRKIICGWSNKSCKGIIHKMNESEMSYRGSKSLSLKFNESVKEQRVNGSWCINYNLKTYKHLRYTLFNYENSHYVNNLSKQYTNKHFFSTKTESSDINPWFIIGFIDAEGSFSISLSKNIKKNKNQLNWKIEPRFQLGLHIKDITLLILIQKNLNNIGNIYQYSKKKK